MRVKVKMRGLIVIESPSVYALVLKYAFEKGLRVPADGSVTVEVSDGHTTLAEQLRPSPEMLNNE